LEDPLSRHAEVRARIKARQADLLSKATGQIGNLAEPLKEWLLNFMEKQGGSWDEEQAPAELAQMLADGKIDLTA
jgi:hypothetical protein